MECVSQNIHRIEGKINIPENKREEFNRNVYKILKMCGIRKVDEMEIGGQNVTVVRMPEVDANGMVSFDYSIFEKWKREVATYNIYTNELCMEYSSQVNEAARIHRKEKDYTDSAEFLSGFKKEDKLTPVITLTVYWGAEQWAAPRSLHDMIDDKYEAISAINVFTGINIPVNRKGGRTDTILWFG